MVNTVQMVEVELAGVLHDDFETVVLGPEMQSKEKPINGPDLIPLTQKHGDKGRTNLAARAHNKHPYHVVPFLAAWFGG